MLSSSIKLSNKTALVGLYTHKLLISHTLAYRLVNAVVYLGLYKLQKLSSVQIAPAPTSL